MEDDFLNRQDQKTTAPPHQGHSKPNSGTAPRSDRQAKRLPINTSLLRGTNWLTRDIPEPDFIMGELMSTTSRLAVVGPTGIGKSNFLLALGMAAADGEPFLHWLGSNNPHRILFIDGEMSQRLAKKRLIDAERRHGSMPDTFFYMNRDDFPELQPLNSAPGRKFIDAVIEDLGGVDGIIFDNVQALTAGDDSFGAKIWHDMLPWILDLTRRGIGQIWVLHTGQDETHAWGSKTREWQLDTVLLLDRVDLPQTDIAFALNYQKARERTPDNHADFEPAIVSLAADQWVSQRGGETVRSKKRMTSTDRALDLLKDAIAREGTIPPANGHIPPDTYCVHIDLWRAYCDKGLPSEGDPTKQAEAKRKQFKRAEQKLVGPKVGKWDPWVWVVGQPRTHVRS